MTARIVAPRLSRNRPPNLMGKPYLSPTHYGELQTRVEGYFSSNPKARKAPCGASLVSCLKLSCGGFYAPQVVLIGR